VTVVAERLYTIPITCCLDGRAHDVTDQNVAAGWRAGGRYEALCGYVVVPAAMVAPIGRPCARCAAVVTSHRLTPATAPVRRLRRRQRGRLWRMLHPHGRAAEGTVTGWLP
jgi:hypothetical protein